MVHDLEMLHDAKYGVATAPSNSPGAGHDAPHPGKTLELNAVSDLLCIIQVAVVDRRYDFVVTRRLELIPHCLEIGCHLGVSYGHAGKQRINLVARRLHLRLERVLRRPILSVQHRIERNTSFSKSHANLTHRISPSDRSECQSDGEYCCYSDRLLPCHQGTLFTSRRLAHVSLPFQVNVGMQATFPEAGRGVRPPTDRTKCKGYGRLANPTFRDALLYRPQRWPR